MSTETDERSGPSVNVSHGADATTMSPAGLRLYGLRYRIFAAALAASAIWRPGIWVVAALVAYLGLGIFRSVRTSDRGRGWGPATLIVAPVQLVSAVLSNIFPTVLCAVGLLASLILGIGVVGLLSGATGAVLGLLRGDAGWLLGADAQVNALYWGPHFGPALGCYWAVAHQAKVKSIDLRDRSVEGIDASSPSWRFFVDELGEAGLVLYTAGSTVVLVLFSLLPYSMWAPAKGWEGAAASLHLAGPVNSATSAIVHADVESVVGQCQLFAHSADFVVARPTGLSLAVVVQPARGYFPADAIAVVATLVHNQALPLAHEEIVAVNPPSNARVSVGVNTQWRRFSVVRDPVRILPSLERVVRTSSRLPLTTSFVRSCR